MIKFNPFKDPLSGFHEIKTCFLFWKDLIKDNSRFRGMKTMFFWERLNASHKRNNA